MAARKRKTKRRAPKTITHKGRCYRLVKKRAKKSACKRKKFVFTAARKRALKKAQKAAAKARRKHHRRH